MLVTVPVLLKSAKAVLPRILQNRVRSATIPIGEKRGIIQETPTATLACAIIPFINIPSTDNANWPITAMPIGSSTSLLKNVPIIWEILITPPVPARRQKPARVTISTPTAAQTAQLPKAAITAAA